MQPVLFTCTCAGRLTWKLWMDVKLISVIMQIECSANHPNCISFTRQAYSQVLMTSKISQEVCIDVH